MEQRRAKSYSKYEAGEDEKAALQEKQIKAVAEEKLNCKVSEMSVIGKGASGSVYKVKLNAEPYYIAVKTSDYSKLVFDEYSRIQFISSRVDCKLPKLYFAEEQNGKGFLGMELIDGVEPSAKALIFKAKKRKLANEIVDNLIKIHSAHNDKYGPVDNAVYNSWYEYYSEFAKDIVDFTNRSDVSDTVKKAVNLAYERLYEIIGDETDNAALTHGDYWIPNFIIDTKTMSLKGVIDPFNVMWTEPEYELFTLTVGYGKSLHLYEIYKSKVQTSRNCDTKVELYALFNELLWYKTLGKIGFGYLEFRSRRLLRAISG